MLGAPLFGLLLVLSSFAPSDAATTIRDDQLAVLRRLVSQWGGSFKGASTWRASGSPKACSSYAGIVCDRSGYIVNMSMGDTGIYGSLGDVTKLTKLTYLDLGMNVIQGSLPSGIGNLKKLVSLTISYTGEEGLTGTLPKSLGDLTNLHELYLHKNRLSGSLDVLSSLTKLSKLLLGDNYFSGPFPRSIANLHKLQYLSLRYNNFNGSLPSFLGNLKALSFLSLGYNEFTGVIPRSFASLSNLNTLYLPSNKMNGYVSLLASSYMLADVDLSNNYFTGPLPPLLLALDKGNYASNYFFGSPTVVGEYTGVQCTANDITSNCFSVPANVNNCSSVGAQRPASECSKFCGTSGKRQCGGTGIGICYASWKGSTFTPVCLCASGYRATSDKQMCVK